MDRIRATLAVLVMLLAAASAARPATAAAVPVDLELVLAVDVSGSIDKEDARLQRDGYIAAIVDPRVVAAIRSGILGRIAVTYFEWAGEGWQKPVVGWRLIHDRASAGAFGAELDRTPINVGPWTEVLNVYVMPDQVHTWHIAAGLNSLVALSGYYFFVDRAPRYISQGAWSEPNVLTGLRVFIITRSIMSTYTIAVGLYLTVMATKFMTWPSWSGEIVPW